MLQQKILLPPAPTAQPIEDSGSAAPSDLPPMVATPKKKFGNGKIIATILGFFLLVGGVGAGIVLTQQQQIFKPKATCVGYWCTCGGTTVCNSDVTITCEQYRAAHDCGSSGGGGGTGGTGGGGGGGTGVTCDSGKHLCTCIAGSGCVADSMACSTYCGGSENVTGGGTQTATPSSTCTADGSRPITGRPCCSGTTHTAAGGSETVCGPAPTSTPASGGGNMGCANDPSHAGDICGNGIPMLWRIYL